jgi:hypothetical protein
LELLSPVFIMLALVYAYHLTPVQHSPSRVYAGEKRTMPAQLNALSCPQDSAACATAEDLQFFSSNITADVLSAIESYGVLDCAAPTLTSESSVSSLVHHVASQGMAGVSLGRPPLFPGVLRLPPLSLEGSVME